MDVVPPYFEGAQSVFCLDLLQYRGRSDHPRPTGGQEGVLVHRVRAGRTLELFSTLGFVLVWRLTSALGP